MPLQYPLMFPYGEEGWSPRLHLHQVHSTKEKRLTVNMYYSYQIHDRAGVYSLLLHGGRLFQQYLVDAYTCIEQNRLTYYSTHQDQLRSEYIAGVYDALSRGDTESREIGKRIFLPASFTGGPRYMHRHYQNALAICRVHGNPQYFITFTCNVKWPEITRYMDNIGSNNSQHCPDIIARVFKLKVEDFIKFMKADKTFGDVAAYLYTIEFQKRGLPHCHTLLWVTEAYKIQDAAAIDNYITTEFPDPQSEASLYQTITECMLHGPCGLLNPATLCMREDANK
ncbi:putative helitron helicase-like domain-containing protein [Helianthus annuus]|nr:putative helitron helicase-like domain-containing protein [Helianthus annuus]